MGRRTALITGITGQDGSYLTEFLLAKGYQVHGIIRRASTFNTGRISHLYQDPHARNRRLFLHYGDLTDGEQLTNLIYNVEPDEIYHLGAQSHVRVSFDTPEYTGNVTALGTTRILEAVRRSGIRARFYQASSSEMFGNAPPPQDERTPFAPASPYAVAKLYSFHQTLVYRASYGMFAANGILFNHESPRRGETFVTRKITRGLAAIMAGTQRYLYLGNLDAKRDWGYAPDYVEAMWAIVQHRRPEDFVIGTGETRTVRDFLKEAFGYVGKDWRHHVRIDPRYFRPVEVLALRANPAKAKRLLKWSAEVSFRDLVRIMVDADLTLEGLSSPGAGKAVEAKRLAAWR